MGLTEEVRSMEEQGMNDEEIIRTLQGQGVPMANISNALSTSKIKMAVNEDSSSATEISGGELEPSISSPQASSEKENAFNEQPMPNQSYGQSPPGQYQDYQQYPVYDSYSSGISPDTINEIAEQVMLEKLLPIKDKLEQALEFRTMIETKIGYVDERLKKIEKIIDRLQLSVLQKVGDYVTNVEDLKREVQETQKSFKYLIDEQSSKNQKPATQSNTN